GAPWLDTTVVLRRLREAAPVGVRFEGTTFKPGSPGDGKYPDTLVTGIRLTTIDRKVYDPTITAVYLLAALKAAHPQEFAFRPSQFDRLAGGPDLRTAIESAIPVPEIASRWRENVTRFKERRRSFLLYPD
ncbi:MAG TPA: hypothetical protein VKA25_10205, partial [Gemmatimonadales bacterium]|nr:hypothetical protein [Gemmatimonadales bacterium]